MRMARLVLHRLRALFRQSHAEADLQREIDLHLEQLSREHASEGLSESDARLAARRDFGSVAVTEERCRDTRRINFIEDLKRDLAFAFRALRKSPGFALTAILSLALGIGANSAIYSFMDAIMMRALPVPDPQNLVIVNWRAKGSPAVAHGQHSDGGSPVFPYPAWELLRDHNDTFSTLFAFASAGRLNVVAGNQAFLGSGEYVSGNYFSGVDTAPLAGRLIGNEDDHPGSAAVAVISYRVTQQRFNGVSNAVGQTILINRKPFTVVGVTAPRFYGLDPRNSPDIFVPLHCLPAIDPRIGTAGWFYQNDNYWVQMVGRLRSGVTLRQSEAAMAAKFHRFVAATARNEKERTNLPELWLETGGSGLDSLRRDYAKPLYVLLAMTGVILLIACSNIANLLLSRAAARRREIAVRLSLGARRSRIVRQLLTESILLALLGGMTGLFVAAASIRFLTWLLSNGEDNFALHAGVDARTLLFALVVSAFAGILFGLAPALQATKVDVAPALKESRDAGLRGGRFGLRIGLSQILVAGQIALSLLLVVAAGLFVRTVMKLDSISLGFNPQKLLVFSIDAKQAGYDERRSETFYARLRENFARIPGVRAATMTDMPLVADSASANGILIPGMRASGKKPATSVTVVGPSFFHTMQIPILLGRGIEDHDMSNAGRVAVVNEVFANKFFPGLNPIGRHFAFEEEKPIDVQIVGMAKNSLYSSLKSAVPPVAYLPWSQSLPGWLTGGMYYELRTVGDPLLLADTVRKIVREANPLVPVADLRTQVRYIQATIAPERTFADLCTCYGFLALLIACVGLYGTTAYAVARRTNEIGIRIALGAKPGRVIWMVQREVLVLSLAGLAVGLCITRVTARLVASLLFDVSPNDLTVFGLATVILLLCALAAGYAPALRASSIDPVEALRNE